MEEKKQYKAWTKHNFWRNGDSSSRNGLEVGENSISLDTFGFKFVA